MNRPQVHICPLILNPPPTFLPTPSVWLSQNTSFECSALCIEFALVIYFTYGNRWGNSGKQCQTLFWGALKSLQMVIAAMKLKDAYSLEGKL